MVDSERTVCYPFLPLGVPSPSFCSSDIWSDKALLATIERRSGPRRGLGFDIFPGPCSVHQVSWSSWSLLVGHGPSGPLAVSLPGGSRFGARRLVDHWQWL